MPGPTHDADHRSTTPRALAREALAAGDATSALDHIDALPSEEQAEWLIEVWMLAGSVRAVGALAERIADPELRARARAFVTAPPVRALPAYDDADAYRRLLAQADRLAALGRAAELALTHLSLSRASPRSDWRAVHVEHAAALAFGLGDPRLAALVRAFEAERELDFGELEDALEAARAAIAAGLAHDEPRAVALAEAVLARAAANVGDAGAADAREPALDVGESEDRD